MWLKFDSFEVEGEQVFQLGVNERSDAGAVLRVHEFQTRHVGWNLFRAGLGILSVFILDENFVIGALPRDHGSVLGSYSIAHHARTLRK